RAASRVPRSAGSEVVAARRVRLPRRDPQDLDWQVRQEGDPGGPGRRPHHRSARRLMSDLRSLIQPGSYTPVVTPFADEDVDYAAFDASIERQVAGGSHGVVVTGNLALDGR